MLTLTLRDLQHRRTRFIVVTVLVSVVYTLLFVMTGLVEQLREEPSDTISTFGAGGWVVSDGLAGPFTSFAPLQAGTETLIDRDAVPLVIGRSSVDLADDGTTESVLIGHADEGPGLPAVVEGRPAVENNEIVLDESIGAAVGDEVRVANRPMTVVGLTSSTTLLAGIPLTWVTVAQAQEMVFESRGYISAVLVPDGFDGRLPIGTVLLSEDDVIDRTREPLDDAIASIDLVRALLWVVAIIVVGAVVHLSALERRRDLSVLTAVGVERRPLLATLGVQAVLAALLGVLVAALLQSVLVPVFPMEVRVPTRAYWQLPLLAVGMALLAGASGIRRVLRADPIEAFGGAGA